MLINSCRGGVVSERAVLDISDTRNDILFVFDVWENEPSISAELVSKVHLATPHIAGYSMESKLAAVLSLRDAFVDYFQLVSEDCVSVVDSSDSQDQPYQIKSIEHALQTSLDIEKLSYEFKQAVTENNLGAYFDQVRKILLARREIRSLSLQISNPNNFEQKLMKVLSA